MIKFFDQSPLSECVGIGLVVIFPEIPKDVVFSENDMFFIIIIRIYTCYLVHFELLLILYMFLIVLRIEKKMRFDEVAVCVCVWCV